MSRGLWRWWETKEGVDIWWARVEFEPGQWSDVETADYERQGLPPSFWDLPLKDEHFEATMRDPVQDAEDQARREIVYPGIVALMLTGAVFFVVSSAVTQCFRSSTYCAEQS